MKNDGRKMKSCLVGVKKERKENRSGEFSFGSLILCHSNLGRKEEEGKWYGKNNYKITLQVFIILLYNKNIIVIYFLHTFPSSQPNTPMENLSYSLTFLCSKYFFYLLTSLSSQQNIDSRFNISS